MVGFLVVGVLGAVLGAELYYMYQKEEERIAKENQENQEQSGCCSCGCCHCHDDEEE